MNHLFAYGSLMCEDIMEAVSGCRLPNATGTAKGYSRRSVKGETYPAIVADGTEETAGVVYRDVPAPAWERLDRFEGDMYMRQPVSVELADGTAVAADAYVVRPECLGRLESFGWRFADFLRNGKTSFQREYKGFAALNRGVERVKSEE
jgi:gamma-glutamylcyclotransferase (GGCT)/AIG2-like uncharacterized protein YtfP